MPARVGVARSLKTLSSLRPGSLIYAQYSPSIRLLPARVSRDMSTSRSTERVEADGWERTDARATSGCWGTQALNPSGWLKKIVQVFHAGDFPVPVALAREAAFRAAITLLIGCIQYGQQKITHGIVSGGGRGRPSQVGYAFFRRLLEGFT